MTRVVIVNILRWIGIILFQVLILNRIELHGFIAPYIYPLIILLLPFETPKSLMMGIGFITGIAVDIFANTPGMHASAAVFLAYIRTPIIAINRPIGDYEPNQRPNVSSMGLRWFVGYASMAVVLHHIFYFFVEVFSLAYLPFTLARIVCSALVSLVLIIIYEYIFHSKI